MPFPAIAGGAVVAAPFVTRAATRFSPALINRAAQILQGKIMPEDIRLFGKFAELVERGKAKGNLGETGRTIQSFVKNVFGREAGGWSNLQVKQAIDLLLQQKGIYGR